MKYSDFSKAALILISMLVIASPLVQSTDIIFTSEFNLDSDEGVTSNSNNHNDEIITMIQSINEKMITEYIENLTSFGLRETGSLGCARSAEYIFYEFRQMGLNVKYQNWTSNNIQGSNVEATLVGNNSDEIYIICAHYDTYPSSPGADDNAAGVAVVLSAAKILSLYQFEHTIRFVCFSGEEQGWLGSSSYAEECRSNDDNICAVLDPDAVGYSITDDGKKKVTIYDYEDSGWITDFIDTIAERYFDHILLEIVRGGHQWHSAHTSFHQNGYDALALFEYDVNPYLHSNGDTFENMDPYYTAKVTKLCLATLVELCELVVDGYLERPITPEGPSSGNFGNVYSYSSFTVDSGSSELYYLFDWGDGSKSPWIGPYESGCMATAEYEWTSEGIFNIKVKAKNEKGVVSDWSDPLQIEMPKTKNKINILKDQIENTLKIIQDLFIKYNQFKNNKNILITPQNQHYNYLIISSKDLYESISSSGFIKWKETVGYNIKIVNITDNFITSQIGNDLPQKIRNFLRECKETWSIEYLLLIGSHETIPMRYCYPNPSNHNFQPLQTNGGEHQTDYYYADLSYPDNESWDKDEDGFYGEYGDDLPDFSPELYVGRIPTDDISKLQYTLNKIVSYEQDTGKWKNNVLQAASMFYFENQYNSGVPEIDSARCLSYLEEKCYKNLTIQHYSEQDGIVTSSYQWDPIDEESFINDWRNGKYGIVNWGGHGAPYAVARTIWTRDNGNDIPDTNEISSPLLISINSNLDDDYPSIVCALSCMVGCLEDNEYGVLGVEILTKPSFGSAVAILCNTRLFYATDNWPNSQGGMESILYHFYDYLVLKNQRLGEAFYNAKYLCNQEYGWPRYTEYINQYILNLYGDPSLFRLGIDMDEKPEKPSIPNGPTECKLGKEYYFNSISYDPDNDEIYYLFNWGDGTDSGWLGPFASGQMCNISHIWNIKGSWEIKVKVKDINGFESGWSDPLFVSSSKIKNIEYNKIDVDDSFKNITMIGEKKTTISNMYGFVEEWNITYGGPSWDQAIAVEQTIDGGYVFGGTKNADDYDINGDFWLLKTDSIGYVLWEKSYGGADTTEWCHDICMLSDGGFALIGSITQQGSTDSDLLLIKTDEYGSEEWFKIIGGTENDRGIAIQQMSNQEVIISGVTSSFGENEAWLIKTDRFGNEIWSKTFGGNDTYGEYLVTLLENDQGDILAAGRNYHGGASDTLLIKIDKDGATIWEKNVGIDNKNNAAMYINTVSDGGYILTGQVYRNQTEHDIYLLKINSNGNTEWIKFFGSPYFDTGMSVEEIDDGKFLITGEITINEDVPFIHDIFLIITDSEGEIILDMVVGGDDSDQGFEGWKTKDGGLIIAGNTESYGSGNKDAWLIKFISVDNNRPLKPDTPIGPASVRPNMDYEYSTSTIDLDGDQLYYKWDWGDGTQTEWLGPYNSGESCKINHSWEQRGDHEIKVKAKDTNQCESEWSDLLRVTIPKMTYIYIIDFLKFIMGLA